jgi:hypothetical protein
MQLKFLPIPKEYIDKIRQAIQDDFGHKIEISIAGENGYGPCRCCLKRFKHGEKRLLFSYAPVGSENAYNEVGPVYIHEDCVPYSENAVMPEEIKNGNTAIHLVLRCYSAERKMILACYVKNNQEAEDIIVSLFEDPQIKFIHLRNATYQCFIAEVRRVQGTGS